MAKSTYFGYTMPFVSSAGILPLQADERLIKNDLLLLLYTIPGQRVMRPGFGTPINAFPFEIASNENLSLLRDAIITAIKANEPRVIVRDVIVSESVKPNLLNVSILVSLAATPNTTFDVAVQLNLSEG